MKHMRLKNLTLSRARPFFPRICVRNTHLAIDGVGLNIPPVNVEGSIRVPCNGSHMDVRNRPDLRIISFQNQPLVS